MNVFFRGAACASLLALVAGCCANNSCDCDDLYADSLYLALANNTVSADTVSTSFTRAELDTVYLQRYSPATPLALSDPVTIIAEAQQATLNSRLKMKLTDAHLPLTTLVISNNNPFPPSNTGGKLSAYNYLLTVQDKSAKPRKPPYLFYLENIQVKGQYNADGCCTCYQNTAKRFQVNGGPVREVTEKGQAPIAVALTKKEAR